MRILYQKIKTEVLGKEYDLSLAFLRAEEMRAVTLRTKNKDHISNVLSFPLSKTTGEILICRKAAPPFSIGYLFIHGLFHLKGYKHGVRMEAHERRILKQFKLTKHEQNRHRN